MMIRFAAKPNPAVKNVKKKKANYVADNPPSIAATSAAVGGALSKQPGSLLRILVGTRQGQHEKAIIDFTPPSRRSAGTNYSRRT
jgi:hypothetical protein